jgi:L-threonylcarbamoyladenylate synthase
VPAATTGGLSTVAVRVPDHPVATALLTLADLPVAAPSANRSGRPSPTTAEHVAADLGAEVDVILDGGPCPVGVESTVVDARGHRPVVLREGTITREDLGLGAAADGPLPEADLAASPGTRYRHYAPRCVVELAVPGAVPRMPAGSRRVARGWVSWPPTRRRPGSSPIATVRDVPQLAQRLYAALRDAELAAIDVLVVESVPMKGSGRAVMDRLRRAAG